MGRWDLEYVRNPRAHISRTYLISYLSLIKKTEPEVWNELLEMIHDVEEGNHPNSPQELIEQINHELREEVE